MVGRAVSVVSPFYFILLESHPMYLTLNVINLIWIKKEIWSSLKFTREPQSAIIPKYHSNFIYPSLIHLNQPILFLAYKNLELYQSSILVLLFSLGDNEFRGSLETLFLVNGLKIWKLFILMTEKSFTFDKIYVQY